MLRRLLQAAVWGAWVCGAASPASGAGVSRLSKERCEERMRLLEAERAERSFASSIRRLREEVETERRRCESLQEEKRKEDLSMCKSAVFMMGAACDKNIKECRSRIDEIAKQLECMEEERAVVLKAVFPKPEMPRGFGATKEAIIKGFDEEGRSAALMDGLEASARKELEAQKEEDARNEQELKRLREKGAERDIAEFEASMRDKKMMRGVLKRRIRMKKVLHGLARGSLDFLDEFSEFGVKFIRGSEDYFSFLTKLTELQVEIDFGMKRQRLKDEMSQQTLRIEEMRSKHEELKTIARKTESGEIVSAVSRSLQRAKKSYDDACKALDDLERRQSEIEDEMALLKNRVGEIGLQETRKRDDPRRRASPEVERMFRRKPAGLGSKKKPREQSSEGSSDSDLSLWGLTSESDSDSGRASRKPKPAGTSRSKKGKR